MFVTFIFAAQLFYNEELDFSKSRQPFYAEALPPRSEMFKADCLVMVLAKIIEG